MFCYECHEELLHNPVFLPKDIEAFARLVKARKLNEKQKTVNRKKIAGRITLLHEVIEAGLEKLSEQAGEFDRQVSRGPKSGHTPLPDK